jgi:hypothetical protein
LEIGFLLLLGIVASLVHSQIKIPMHLPGKQGLILITLIVAGRGISGLPYAASITCTGSALMTLYLTGFSSPWMAATYLFIGMIMDLLYKGTSRLTDKPWVLAITCGVTWMFVPLFRLIFSMIADVPMNLFSSGFAYPFLTHLLFGFSGGLAGAGILSIINLKK